MSNGMAFQVFSLWNTDSSIEPCCVRRMSGTRTRIYYLCYYYFGWTVFVVFWCLVSCCAFMGESISFHPRFVMISRKSSSCVKMWIKWNDNSIKMFILSQKEGICGGCFILLFTFSFWRGNTRKVPPWKKGGITWIVFSVLYLGCVDESGGNIRVPDSAGVCQVLLGMPPPVWALW